MSYDVNTNYFAYFMLLIWPAVAIYFYGRLPVAQATMWTILGGYLLLPLGTFFHFTALPIDFDKRSIATISAFFGCTLVAGRRLRFFPNFGIVEVLILLIIICPFISSILNTDELRFGPTVMQASGPYDGVSAVVAQFIAISPFFLGRQFLRNSECTTGILRILAVVGLAYSLPMLFEIRMSPQLHYWLYGHPAFGMSSESRYGGFRPTVFIGNGLLVAFFAMTATVAAAALSRTQSYIVRFASGGIITAYLSVVLVLCKTLSALMYAALLVPLVRWANPRLQLLIACVLVSVALIYPMLRFDDLVPTARIVEAASVVNADRAESLKFRFDQEKLLLDRAMKRPWFGWGRYGRNRVYNQYGTDITIIDGYWINLTGSYGLVAFITFFGLMVLIVFRAATSLKYIRTMGEQIHFSALVMIVAINIFNLLPNTSISAWTWLVIGALVGRTEILRAAVGRRSPMSSLQHAPARIQTEPKLSN
jgi:hypothetical protein